MNGKNAGLAFGAALSALAALSVQAAPVWTAGTYALDAWTATPGNVLSGATATSEINYYRENGKAMSENVATLTDGQAPGSDIDYGMVVGVAGGSVSWVFPKASIAQLKIYTRWGDGGRDGVNIASVWVKKEGETEWTNTGASNIAYGNDNNSGPGLYGILSNSDGSPLATDIVGLKIEFAGQDNNGGGYVEIEAVDANNNIRWVTGSWDIDSWAPGPNNVLSGLEPAEGSSGLDVQGEGLGTARERLTDGTAKGPQTAAGNGERTAVSNGAVLIYTLPEAADIKEFRFYSMWNDGGRDRIDIFGIDYSTDDGANWTTVANSMLVAFETPQFRNRACLTTMDGSVLAPGAKAVRIRFAGQENNYVGYSEIEALAVNAMPSGRIEVKERTCSSVKLAGIVSDLGFGATATDVYLAIGDDPDNLPEPEKIGTVSVADDFALVEFTGLSANTTYYYAWYLESDNDHATARATGSFTTASLIPVVDGEALIVPAGDFAELAEATTVQIPHFQVNGTLTVDANATLGAAGVELSRVGDGGADGNADVNAHAVLRAGSTVTLGKNGNDTLLVGTQNGRGQVTVEAGAVLDASLGNLMLANNWMEQHRDWCAYGQLDIYGTVKALELSANGWYPPSSPTPTPLEYQVASRVNIYEGGLLEIGLYRGWDYARCDVSFHGGTLRFTGADQPFQADDVVCFAWTFAEGTVSTIDVGNNDVTLAHNKDRYYFFGGGEIRKRGSGRLTINAVDTGFTGKIVVEEGSLALGAAFTKGTEVEVLTGATFLGRADTADAVRLTVDAGGDFFAPANQESKIQNLVLNGTLTLEDATAVFDLTGPATLNGGIRGAGAFKKSGTGTVTSCGVNTYTGDTLVSGGTFVVAAAEGVDAAAATIPAESIVQVAPGATLKVETAMTLAKLRVALDAAGNATLDGFKAANEGKLYLTREAEAEAEESIGQPLRYDLPLTVANLSAESAQAAQNWHVYLNGQRIYYRLVLQEGEGRSYVRRIDGFQVLIR